MQIVASFTSCEWRSGARTKWCLQRKLCNGNDNPHSKLKFVFFIFLFVDFTSMNLCASIQLIFHSAPNFILFIVWTFSSIVTWWWLNQFKLTAAMDKKKLMNYYIIHSPSGMRRNHFEIWISFCTSRTLRLHRPKQPWRHERQPILYLISFSSHRHAVVVATKWMFIL